MRKDLCAFSVSVFFIEESNWMLFFVYQVSEAGSVCLLSLLKKVCSLSLVKHAFLAVTILVRVPKPRSGSKYLDVLRSPQKLKMFWGPHSRAL